LQRVSLLNSGLCSAVIGATQGRALAIAAAASRGWETVPGSDCRPRNLRIRPSPCVPR